MKGVKQLKRKKYRNTWMRTLSLVINSSNVRWTSNLFCSDFRMAQKAEMYQTVRQFSFSPQNKWLDRYWHCLHALPGTQKYTLLKITVRAPSTNKRGTHLMRFSTKISQVAIQYTQQCLGVRGADVLALILSQVANYTPKMPRH